LIELNKKYILLIINYVMKISNTTSINNIQPNYTTNQYRKIKIHPDEHVKESITFEEIQNDRKTFFEKELNKKQEEFTNAMSLPVPPVPNFSDNLDEPISEIELEIKRIQEQRNYDIEMINNTNKNTKIAVDENWLQPQETSIKNEKLVKNTFNSEKHITWKDELKQQNLETENQDDTNNIFGKLKQISISNIDFENNTSDKSNIEKNNNHKFQLQIDEIKKDIFVLNEKLDLILQKIKN